MKTIARPRRDRNQMPRLIANHGELKRYKALEGRLNQILPTLNCVGWDSYSEPTLVFNDGYNKAWATLDSAMRYAQAQLIGNEVLFAYATDMEAQYAVQSDEVYLRFAPSACEIRIVRVSDNGKQGTVNGSYETFTESKNEVIKL